MKEGAIIHRYGANSVLRSMMTVTTNDGHILDLQANHRAMPCAGKPATQFNWMGHVIPSHWR